jgi:hypothetical protein
MIDVLMVLTIIAFFAAAAVLVRGLGRIIADADSDAEAGGDADGGSDAEIGTPGSMAEPGRPA